MKLDTPFELRWTQPSDAAAYTFSLTLSNGNQLMLWTAPADQLTYNFTLYENWVSTGPATLEFSTSAIPLDYAPDMRIQVDVMLEVPIHIDP